MPDGFNGAVQHVLREEGGFVQHPRDPGGATNMGITHRTLAAWRGGPVTVHDVRGLSRDEAIRIYRAEYWRAVRGDDLPPGVGLVVFDGAVNSGPSRAVRWMQKAAGVRADGIIGPVTLRAVRAAHAPDLIRAMCDIRRTYLRGLPTFGVFGRGWSARVNRVEAAALAAWEMSVPARDVPALDMAADEAAPTVSRGLVEGVRAAAAGGVAGGGADLAGLGWQAVAVAAGVVAVLLLARAWVNIEADRRRAAELRAASARLDLEGGAL